MMITRDEFVTVLWEQCVPPINSSDACLTPQQNLLLKTLTRLPDLLSSKRGNQLNPSLYPSVYFKNLANVIHCCLKRVVDSIRSGYKLINALQTRSIKYMYSNAINSSVHVCRWRVIVILVCLC